jgi:hypothetical protein
MHEMGYQQINSSLNNYTWLSKNYLLQEVGRRIQT